MASHAPSPRAASRTRSPAAVLRTLAEGWQQRVQSPRSRAELAAATLVLLAALLLARRGTPPARAAAVLCVALPIVALAWRRARERALWREPSRVVSRLAGRVDPDRAGRAIRALGLIADPVAGGTSVDLAQLHVARTLGALPQDRILDRAVRIGARYGRVAVLLATGAIALGATRGFAVFEGADVLVATRHAAPVAILWMDGVDIDARPPDYLHELPRPVVPYGTAALPRGTILTFRGSPIHPGRRLLLTDGTTELPFEDDGERRVVAHWTLAESAALRVVARFGDVTIAEADHTRITSIQDEAPVVELEGAPREIRLANLPAEAGITIKYDASDDHGLREVHLVLRSGLREDRRILARLDGETEMSRGGLTIPANDPFLRRSHAPIEVRVEAEDNDPVTGPKWGASAAITIIPPEAGEPEALRMDALRKLRDVLVDSLAARVDHAPAASAAEHAALAQADRKSVESDTRALDATARGSYAGVGIHRRLVALLRGQLRQVVEASSAEVRSPGVASHEKLVAASERLVLVADAIARGLAQRDARSVARGLADAADDLALGASQMSRPRERERGATRVEASIVVLEGGARSLVHLGALGRDLGEIIQMDLARVARARDDDDLVHAELAASDLAARLMDPAPSFGAAGSSGGSAGGESGGRRGTPGKGEPPDDAQQAFEQAAEELDRLSADHAAELGKVEQIVNEPEGADQGHEGGEEAKAHARAVREATRPLPSVGAGSDSWTNRGAAAREQAEAMARALEEGNTADAVSAGRSALDAITEAKHVADAERWMARMPFADQDPDRTGAERTLEAARAKLDPEVKWAEERLRVQRKGAAAARAAELAAHGDEEARLGERAAALRARGEGPQALPETALEALHQAERSAGEASAALKHGDVDDALVLQREAQRRLETARDALGADANDDPNGSGRAVNGDSGDTSIPGADAHKGPEEFRRRVMQGLGQAARGRQKDAVRRYADGLLR